MCQYRYSYYPVCRHQETVLVKYCEHARPAGAPAPPAGSAPAHAAAAPVTEGPAPAYVVGARQARRKKEWQGRMKGIKKKIWQRKEKEQMDLLAGQLRSGVPRRGAPCSPVQERDSSCSGSCSSFVTAAEYIDPSPAGIGSASITEEPYSQASSSIAIEHQEHSSCPSIPDEMAGLRPFAVGAFNWMAGGPATQPPASEMLDTETQEHASTSLAVSPIRVREPGIRADSDESFDLPNSSDILQHLAESPRHYGIFESGLEDHRQLSYASVTSGRSVNTQDNIASIEAEVDALKETIQKLKEDGENIQTTGEHQQSTIPAWGGLGIRHSAVQRETEELSPAARMQRQHELEASRPKINTAVAKPEIRAPPQDMMHFPTLGGKTAETSIQAPGAPAPGRKRSYADAASVRNKAAVGNNSTRKRADSKIPAPTMPVVSHRPIESEMDDDRSVIVSPLADSATAFAPTMGNSKLPSSPNGKAAKTVPRFAQPTQSFASRAGETIHRESSAAAVKSPSETSPAKSARGVAPDVEFGSKASHHKRKSLPSGWAGVVAAQPQAAKFDIASGTSSSLTVITSPTSNGEWQLIGSETAAQAGNAPKAAVQQQSPRVRKKTSFMSPTEATTQRTIATISEEPGKRPVHKIKSAGLRVDTERARQSGGQPFPETTSASTGSSGPSPIAEKTVSSDSPSRKGTPQMMAQSLEAGRAKAPKAHQLSHMLQSPGSPKTKIPQARRNTKQQAGNDRSPIEGPASATADAGLLLALPLVPNTITTRRTSHANILKPIFDKLENVGLRRVSPERKNISEHGAKAQKIREASQQQAEREESDRQASAALSDIVLLARQGNAGGRVMSPMRPEPSFSRNVSALESGIAFPLQQGQAGQERGSSSRQAGSKENHEREVRSHGETVVLPALHPALSGPSQPTFSEFAAQVRRISANSAAEMRASSAAASNPKPSSLRATAQTFQPIWKPESPAHKLGLLSWDRSLDRYTQEQWAALPGNVQKGIVLLRQYQHGKVQAPGETSPMRTGSPSKRSNQRFWGPLINQTPPSTSNPSMAHLFQAGGATNTASQHSVQVGQVLSPTFIPGKKRVQWDADEPHGSQKAISSHDASRAVPYEDNSTPVISPTSNDTSPMKTPHSAPAWTIGAGYDTKPYGWAGGAGKEIAFTGCGPQAEYNAMSPVDMQYHAVPWVPEPAVPRRVYKPQQPKVWPKSQKQWAEYARNDKMIPCGNMDFLSATENIPLAQYQFGQCHDCVP
ncbi:hypothetical protein LTR53_016159 [Teratosphaeriaceae sp. CCFEE 6253]|nr:hypothetical protein LTR53_016159 [Teratosphaeriaceae sp. CCFEE 6253]